MAVLFDVIVRTAAGNVAAHRRLAADAAEASSWAQGRGWQVVRCELVAREAVTAKVPGGGGMRGRRWDSTRFAQEVAALISGGLSILEAVETLMRQEVVAANRERLQAVIKSITQGSPFSAALQQAGGFPPLLVATVIASEQSGDLATSLDRYAEHQVQVLAVRDRVVGAAIYPALLVVVGIGVIFFLLGVVVPRFAVLIESTRAELPWSSQLLMRWGRLFAANSTVIFSGLGIALIAAGFKWRQLRATGFRQAWVERLPFIGLLARQFRQAQFYRTVAMLLKGGIAAPRALMLGTSLLGEIDSRQLATAIGQIQAGQELGLALGQAGLADEIATSMLGVAQKTGSLSDAFERIATFYERNLQRSIEVGSRLFEPLLMIFIGLVIGMIVVLMYMPIFDLASSLQ
jgi:general secretion pathway protein F